MRLSRFERRVLVEISGVCAQGDVVQAQLARARVDQREHTKHGFRTFFQIDAAGRHLDKRLWKTEHMPAVQARHAALRRPARFTLVIADGFISCLIADSHGERWPSDEVGFVFERPTQPESEARA